LKGRKRRTFEAERAAGLGLAALLVACRAGHHVPTAEALTSARPLSSANPSGAGSVSKVVPSSKQAKRMACGFRAGAEARDTLDPGEPIGKQIPIDHFVVVLQENRSFDQFFQGLPAFGQSDVDVAPASFENADPSGEGEVVHPYLLHDPCIPDVPHNWLAVHQQIAEGKMSGFLSAANPEGKRALGYYDASTLGYYYALANTFAIGDRYFASVPGPTFPNRLFSLAATSFGHVKNTPPPPRDEERTLFHQLEKKGLSWIVFATGPTFEEDMFPRLHQEKGEHFRPLSEFFKEAEAGTLPFFSWVESSYEGPDATDEHAPANVQVGQAFVSRVVGQVMNSSNWPRTALFVSYDEHGGFFDHVPPPTTCPPDTEPPHIAGQHTELRFNRLGVRVPFIVVSPFARAHFVSHRVHSHTSLLRLVEARAELPALTDRDANDDPPFEFFDFDHPAFLTPPSLPAPVIDPEQAKRCVVVAAEAEAKRKKAALAHPSSG